MPSPARPSRARRLPPAFAAGLALAIPLSGLYLLLSPPSADLAAATYRSDLFSRVGFTVWDNGWYAGHALPAYSLLSPALGAWLGPRLLLALSALAASALYGLLLERLLPYAAALASTLVFAFGFCAELPSGRVPYDLSVAIGLLALLVFLRGPLPLALALALLTSAGSPVAGAFLALAGVALAVTALVDARRPAAAHDAPDTPLATIAPAQPPPADAPDTPLGTIARTPSPRAAARTKATPGLALCAASLLPVLLLSAMFPEGGVEPFAPGAFWPELAATVVFAALLPKGALKHNGRLAIRIGAALYALALTASFLLRTPVGGNVVRLGAMFGAPLVVAAAWGGSLRLRGGVPRLRGVRSRPAVRSARARSAQARAGRARSRPLWLLALLVPLLLYWQLATAIDDQVALAGDPTVKASFYAPLRFELLSLAHRKRSPIRVEVPLTGAHWESAYLPGGPISIARGWERQLDVRYGGLFYGASLKGASAISEGAYRRWLSRNAIAYVALPRARLDSAGRAEAQLIEHGVPYLREAWRDSAWRLYEVRGATPIVQAPAQAISVGTDSFAFEAPMPGRYLVHLHWTPYWSVSSGSACVAPGEEGLTLLRVHRAGRIEVGIELSLGRVLGGGGTCG